MAAALDGSGFDEEDEDPEENQLLPPLEEELLDEKPDGFVEELELPDENPEDGLDDPEEKPDEGFDDPDENPLPDERDDDPEDDLDDPEENPLLDERDPEEELELKPLFPA